MESYLSDNPPNILFLIVDSLRKDLVNNETMPYLSKIKESGIWFNNLQACAPATMASFPAIMASRYTTDINGIGLPEKQFVTLTEALPRIYTKYGHSTNNLTGSYYNYDRGFDIFNSPNEGLLFKIREKLGLSRITIGDASRISSIIEQIYFQFHSLSDHTIHPSATTVNDNFISWRSSDEPFFAWLHYMDVHDPYEPPSEYLPPDFENQSEARNFSREHLKGGVLPEENNEAISSGKKLYQSVCRYWDDCFRDLHRSVPENTLTIIVSDHGELLGEYERWGHLHEMWEELINVPLIIHHPDLPNNAIRSQQTLLDLAPTILQLIGSNTPPQMRGTPIDLFNPTGRELTYGVIQSAENVGYARTEKYKWVRHRSGRTTEPEMGELLLENSDENPEMGKKLIDKEDLAEPLRQRFVDEVNNEMSGKGKNLEEDKVKEHLRQLGYLETD